MVTERAIINALIIGACLILVPFLISSSLSGLAANYLPLLCFVVLVALAMGFFVLKDTLCAWPLLGGSIMGSLNFLPLPLRATHIFCILLILYYITGYVIVRQERIRLGKAKFLWPILILTLIVLYHNHDFALHVLGGETEGAKPAILIYLVVFAYFCGINVASPSVAFFSRVPLYYVILTALSGIPYFLTTYIPSLAPALYYLTDSVNVNAYLGTQLSSTVGPESGIGRFAPAGPLGVALQLYLLCYYPIATWLRPDRWWVAGLSLICGVLVVLSGYRNELFGFALTSLVAIWCYYSWRSFFLIGMLVIGVLVLFIASSNNVIHLPVNKLPLIAQRTLSFLPADWDEEAIESGEASNDFRKSISEVYRKEYLTKSPLIGNGFDINTKEYNNLSDMLQNGRNGGDPVYLQAKTYIEGKMFHTGWISLYDTVGIVGFITFLILGWNEWRLAAHFVFGPNTDRQSPLFPFYVWILCNVVGMMGSFFTVFGDFAQAFTGLCIYAIVLSQLSDMENAVPVALPDRKGQFELTDLKGPLYGYRRNPRGMGQSNLHASQS